MADKSFGVKELNLISASGTPTITSPNSVNINATNVAISTDITVGGMVSLGAGTSISSPGSNVLTFGTNSTEKVRITSSGLFGIGTDNPTKALHLAQNSDIAIRMDSNNANANARTWEIVVGGNASNNAEMVFRTRQDDGTGGSECARIKRNGVIALPSGGGIDFSATSDGGTGTPSELLDDYEEGTWTPTGTSDLSSFSNAHYIKVGRLVTITCRLDFSTNSSTTRTDIGGLPFTPDSNLSNSAMGNSVGETSYISTDRPFACIEVSGVIRFRINGNTNMTYANWSGKNVRMSLTYFSN